MIGERLKEFRQAVKLNQIEFAKELGIKQNVLSNYENGISQVPNDVIIKLIDKHYLNSNWLLTGSGEKYNNLFKNSILDEIDSINIDDDKIDVKLVTGSKINLVSEKLIFDQKLKAYVYNKLKPIYIPHSITEPYPENTILAFISPGDAMKPTISRGDYIIFIEDHIQDNDIYVIVVNGELKCKRLAFGANGDISVISDNTQYVSERLPKDKINFKIIGRVIGWLHKNF